MEHIPDRPRTDEEIAALPILDLDEAIKQVSPDRAVITDDDREMCRACGELPATRGMYCRRCDDSITEDRLERRER